MHIEITDGSSKFPRKLFQFERALEFREQLVGCSLPKALILVLNGSIGHMNQYVRPMKLSAWPGTIRKPHIFSVPCYICFKPYANVYTILKSIQSDLQSQRQGLQLSFCWSMMSHEELLAECRLSHADDKIDGKSRAELFKILMSRFWSSE